MPEDQPPTYHPPPYGTETHDPAAPSPSYELDDLSLGAPPPPNLTRPPLHPLAHPISSSASIPSALTLDDVTIKGCAPKKAPRKPLLPPWLLGTRKGKALVGASFLLLVGLIGAMIWYGVDRAKVKKGAFRVKVDSYLDVARITVVPQVRFRLEGEGEGEVRASSPFSPPSSFVLLRPVSRNAHTDISSYARHSISLRSI